MALDLLDQILVAAQIGETTDWEFKSARGGFPGNFWETYSAMANSEGGTIVLGAREEDHDVRLDGLTGEQLSRLQKILWDGLNNRATVSRNLLAIEDVQVVELTGAKLLAVRVPRAGRTERPVYLGPNPFGHTFRRQHEGDYRCTDEEVRRMLADADPTPADHRILAGFSLDDLDPASLPQYRQRLRTAKGEHPWLALNDRELLERLGGWRRDRELGGEGLTLAGLLMFGKDLAIRDPAAVPRYFVDYREKLDPAIRWTDRILPDGTWEANLFQFYQRVWPKLATGLPTPFRLEGVERRDVTPAHEALREAFVNALIHADYAVGGGIVLERHLDRFTLENPGTLLISLQQYHRGGVSECRNRALQVMFSMIGGGEQAGSGADKIRAGWRAQHWRAPQITVQSQPDRVRLTLPMVSLIPDDTLERLRQRFGQLVDALSPAETQALATADIEEAVSNTRLQELLADHPVDITRTLQRLCEQGLLVSDNRRRWTTYRLGEGTNQGTAPLFPEDSSHLPGDSSHSTADSPHSARDSSHSPVLQEDLRTIAAPVADKARVPAILVRKVIMELCSGRYLTAAQLAKLLFRNAEGLRDRYLSPMVSEGILQLRYPAATNRPDQAYIRVEGGL